MYKKYVSRTRTHMHTAKSDAANLDAARRELDERQEECKELHEALEELENQQVISQTSALWSICFFVDF